MNAKIVKIGKHQWVAGMSWRAFEDKPKVALLREDAMQLGAQWCTVRLGRDVIQAGFCEAIDGMAKPPKAYSLAAAVAGTRKQPWLGIYQLSDDVWWYIAVRDGLSVLPDGDVIGTQSDVYAARERHEAYGDWNYVDGTLACLEQVLTENQEALARVRAVESGHALLWLVTAGVLAVAGAAGYVWWHGKQEDAARARAMAMMRAKLMLQSKASASTRQPQVLPWETQPLPDKWLALCAQHVLPIPLSEYGWGLVSVGCSGTGGQAVWRRLAGATVTYRPTGVLSPDGDTVTQNVLWQSAPASGADIVPDSLSESRARLQGILQGIGIASTISVPPAPAALPGAKASPAPPYAQVQVKFSVPWPPFDLAALFASVHGMRINGIEFATSDWDVTATLYAKGN